MVDEGDGRVEGRLELLRRYVLEVRVEVVEADVGPLLVGDVRVLEGRQRPQHVPVVAVDGPGPPAEGQCDRQIKDQRSHPHGGQQRLGQHSGCILF